MKLSRDLFVLFVVLLAAGLPSGMYAQVSITSTKHNLSISGTGTIKASAENQVCVFCHTPHSKQASTQLWNHQPSTATYTLYNSDYLTSKTYTSPTQPNQRSKLCMSCHDGTIALGAVYNTTGSGSTGTISLLNGVTTMPTSSPSYFGSSLANHHPVGYKYDNAKDPELVARTWPWNTPVKLSPDASTGTVECHTCHDPHDNTYTRFLRISNNNSALCTFCHNKTNWTSSIHQTSTQSYTPPGGTATTIGEWSCRNCHKSHGGAGVPYLLLQSEENTCYQSSCHGSTSPGNLTKDIQTPANKTYRHPTNSVSGKHVNPDNSTSLNVPNRHAECQDCHNPHQAKDGLHALKSNAVSNVLTGEWGVTPGTATSWTQPTTFTITNPVTQENQICFKCHSYYGFGIAVNGVTTIVGPSGNNITDQAMEYNPANRSAHPVRVSASNQTGAVAPKGMAASQMTTAWNSVGTQTMYCSDCHGNDLATSTSVPQGPHGSNQKFMLTGTAKYWPTNATNGLWSLDDVINNRNSWTTNLFCVNCHPLYSGGTFKNNVHSRSNHQGSTVKCITCHVAVPHGAKRSRLIGYATDVAPYNYSGAGTYDKLVIRGFQKASGPNNYQKNYCSMSGVCHGTQTGVYEP